MLNAQPIDFTSADLGAIKNKSTGGNGGGGDMQERVKKLEEQMQTLLVDVSIIKSNYATKADIESVRTEVQGVRTEMQSLRTELHKTIVSQNKWMISLMFTALAAGLTIAKFIF